MEHQQPREEPSQSVSRALPLVYAAAALRMVFPVVILPLMAVRLGRELFGQLSLWLVWAGLLGLLIEGGFLAAATRHVVRADRAQRWHLAQQIFTARCALTVVSAATAWLAIPWLEPQADAGQRLGYTLLLTALACGVGWPATWYVQGSAQLQRWARVELAVYALWLVAAWALANSLQAYLWLQCAALASLSAMGWVWVRRDLSDGSSSLFSRPALVPGVRLGSAMLPVSLAGAVYSLALPAVASHAMGRSELGTYYLADRWIRALLFAADPLYQVVYPRIVARFDAGARAALRYASRWALAAACGGFLLWAALGVLWPWLVQGISARLTTSPADMDLDHLHSVLLVLGLLLPMLSAWKFFGYWMLGSARFDHAYRLAVVVGAIVGLAGALHYAERGAVALAAVALTAEFAVICAAILGMVWTHQRKAS